MDLQQKIKKYISNSKSVKDTPNSVPPCYITLIHMGINNTYIVVFLWLDKVRKRIKDSDLANKKWCYATKKYCHITGYVQE